MPRYHSCCCPAFRISPSFTSPPTPGCSTWPPAWTYVLHTTHSYLLPELLVLLLKRRATQAADLQGQRGTSHLLDRALEGLVF